ncbi:MAG TPA: hypothetical protein VFB45_15330 [Pseudolabrys sp.]|nr:hypothetical protein [Pseudolabrys sp.]
MTKLREGESYSHEGPECPKCGFTFMPDDSIYYDENRYTEETCQECQTKFKVEVYHSTSWTCTIPEPAAAG